MRLPSVGQSATPGLQSNTHHDSCQWETTLRCLAFFLVCICSVGVDKYGRKLPESWSEMKRSDSDHPLGWVSLRAAMEARTVPIGTTPSLRAQLCPPAYPSLWTATPWFGRGCCCYSLSSCSQPCSRDLSTAQLMTRRETA